MGMHQEIYQSKLIAQKELIERFKPGDRVHFGVWYGQPHGAMKALGQYGRDLDPLYVSIIFSTAPHDFYDLPGVRIISGFLGPIERASQARNNNVFFVPIHFTEGGLLERQGRPFDFFVVRVAPMDENGWFNFSLTASWEYQAAQWIARNKPSTKLVFEVNPLLPRVRGIESLGGNRMHISDVDIIVEDDTPLLEFAAPVPQEHHHAIAHHVTQLIENGATLQLGIGDTSMAVGARLKDHRDLGIHTEMFCEAHQDLIEAGAVTNARKGLYDGVSVGTFALGTRRLHQFMTNNPQIVIAPVEAINHVAVLARINKMTSVNSAIMVDLVGQVCSHTIVNRSYSGLGGAFEFAFGSQLSPGGKSIICVPSTTRMKDGTIVSNIVARHPAGTRVTIPEHATDWIATEYGAARLKLLTLEERAAALIGLAHPDFRDALAREAVEAGLRLPRLKEFPAPPAEFFVREDAGVPIP